eukprot:9993593-Alexandrium_andersonii.AAC.1
MYKFALRRTRTIVRDPKQLESLSPWEVEPFLKLRDSGLLSNDHLPDDVSLRAELISWDQE